MDSSYGASFVVDLRRKYPGTDAIAIVAQLFGFGKIIGAGVIGI